MTQFLPIHKETGQPLWTETEKGYSIKVDKAEILIPKPRKNAKKALIQLIGGPEIEIEKKNFDKIKSCCRFLIAMRRKAGDHQIRKITIDTPDNGRYFISEPGIGFQWLTSETGELS